MITSLFWEEHWKNFFPTSRSREEDFDETLEKRLRGPGCDRKQSTQALLRHLARQVQDC